MTRNFDRKDLIFIEIAIFIAFFFSLFYMYQLPRIGWDNNIYCSSVKVFNSGGNPYNVTELRAVSHSDTSFNYIPISIFFLQGLCKFNYISIYLLLVIFSIIVLSRIGKTDWVFLLIFFFAAFGTVGDNFTTGNLGLYELLLFSIANYFIYVQRYVLSSLFLLFTGYLKILPLAHSSLMLLQGKKGIKYFGMVIAGFFIMIALSFAAFPKISKFWILQLLGKIPQDSPIKDGGGFINPSSYWFFKQYFGAITPYFIFVLVCCLLIYFYYKQEKNLFYRFNYGVLMITLMMPRLKPYSFTIPLVAIYLLGKEMDIYSKIFIVLACCVVLFFPFGYINLYMLFVMAIFFNFRKRLFYLIIDIKMDKRLDTKKKV